MRPQIRLGSMLEVLKQAEVFYRQQAGAYQRREEEEGGACDRPEVVQGAGHQEVVGRRKPPDVCHLESLCR